jgi:alpha-ketoglutarate-dependent taurine dioxygenase
MQPKDRLIVNFLHIKELPDTDGDTLFLDLIKGHDHIEAKSPVEYEKYKQLAVEVDLYKIPDFKSLDKS